MQHLTEMAMKKQAHKQEGKCLVEQWYLRGKHSPVVYEIDASRTTANRTKNTTHQI
jgi:hypothetical protein